MSFEAIRKHSQNIDSSELEAVLVWNALTEPGDRIAGMLRLALGSRRALEKVLAGDLDPIGGLSSQDLAAAFQRWVPRYSPSLSSEVLKQAIRSDTQLLLPQDELWPEKLANLGPHAPMAIWFRGNPMHFGKLGRTIAIVGSRTCTNYGQRVTADLATTCVESEAAVVSGGALGVDAVAHRVTVAQRGLTVAVMAGAIDCLYPAGNWELFDEISHTGLLISEMAPGSRPTRWRFLQRNRLIAALADAVVVTEAGWRSGSINTAGHAVELGRRVFAIPGPINSPASAGCNRLIRDQLAELLLDTSDLAQELGWTSVVNGLDSGLGTLELRTFDALTRRNQDFEEVLKVTGLSRDELRMALGGLSEANLAMRTDGGGWKRTK